MARWASDDDLSAYLLQIPEARGVQIGDGNVQYNAFYSEAPPEWPMFLGAPPARAAALQPRDDLVSAVESAWSVGATPLLVGGGGHGKSQLAGAILHDAEAAGVDLTVWLDASSLRSLLGGLSDAGIAVGAPNRRADKVEQRAKGFVGWLRAVQLRWLVVLDNLDLPLYEIAPYLPEPRRGPIYGRLLVTLRRQEAALFSDRRVRIDVGVFEPQEASRYVELRLAEHPELLDGADALIRAVDLLPVGLAQACAALLDRKETCSLFATRIRAANEPLVTVFPEGVRDDYSSTVARIWSLTIAGLRDKHSAAYLCVIALSCFDPGGIPQILLTTPSMADFLVGAEPQELLVILRNFSLIDFQGDLTTGVMRIHALTSRAIREQVAREEPGLFERALLVAIHAVRDLLQEAELGSEVLRLLIANGIRVEELVVSLGSDSFRDCAAAVELALVLARTLRRLGDPSTARDVALRVREVLDDGDGSTGDARVHLDDSISISLWAGGNTAEALRISGRLLDEVRGGDSRLTLLEHGALFARTAGRTRESVRAQKFVLKARDRREPGSDGAVESRLHLVNSLRWTGELTHAMSLLYPLHPDEFLRSQSKLRLDLGETYGVLLDSIGDRETAIDILGMVLREREASEDQFSSALISTRHNCLTLRLMRERTPERLRELFDLLEYRRRALGPVHPDTLTTSLNVVAGLYATGRPEMAGALGSDLVDSAGPVLGFDHPDVLIMRHNVAAIRAALEPSETAIDDMRQVLAVRRSILGEGHYDSLCTLSNILIAARLLGTEARVALPSRWSLVVAGRRLGGQHPILVTVREAMRGGVPQLAVQVRLHAAAKAHL